MRVTRIIIGHTKRIDRTICVLFHVDRVKLEKRLEHLILAELPTIVTHHAEGG